MKALSLSIMAALMLGTGMGTYAQMGQGSSPRGYSSAPTRSTPSYSGGSSGSSGGGYRSSSNSSSPSYNSGGNSGSGRSNTSSGTSGTRNTGGSSSSSGSNSSGNSNSNNSGYYGNNGYYNTPSNNTMGSTGTSSSGGTQNPAYYPQQGDAATNRSNSLKDIRKALSSFDQSTQTFTVSGTEPSTVTGAGGTRMHINPADLVTADGQPISDDINVELKELDSPGKMALAGAPTMSNGDVLISGGSYYFGMTSNGQQVQLRQGSSMQVELPNITTEPDMEVYLGEVDANGNVNWQPTNQPLTPAVANSSNMGDIKGGSPRNETGNNGTSGPRDTNTPTGTRTEGGSNNTNNTSNNGGTRGNSYGTGAYAYYSPTNITRMGWVNCDKGFRGGTKMFVEVEGADPVNTQVFVMYKDVKSLVEGQPEQGFSTNNFIFENIPNKQPVKIVAISKANGVTYTGQIDAVTKSRGKFLVPLKQSTDADAAKMFE